jgi:hypothetical protein
MHARPRSVVLRRIVACHAQGGSDRRDDIPIASMIAARAGRSPTADTVRARPQKPMR